MNSKLPFISVVIPTYKRNNSLKHCLFSLSNQSLGHEHFEVIVVNNSFDPIDDEIKNILPSALFLTETKKGSYAARNKGINSSNGHIIAFTDDDCIPDKNWIKNIFDFFINNNEVMRVTGNTIITRDNETSKIVYDYQKITSSNRRLNAESYGITTTSNCAIKKNIFVSVGLFNESYLSGGDGEWSIRAANRNFPLHYVENIIVRHPSRKNLKELIAVYRRYAGGIYKIKQDKTLFSKNFTRKYNTNKYFRNFIVPLLKAGLKNPFYLFRLICLDTLLKFVIFYEMFLLRLNFKKPNRK